MTNHDADDLGRGLPMSVDNLGFLIDKLGKDAGALQYIRELTQNSIQAVLATPEKAGEIIWDVDWNRHLLTDGREVKAVVIDTGIAMTGPEQIEYMNALAKSTHEQAFDKNYGIGAKITALPKNPKGLVYLSWKDGKGAMTHLWRNPDTGQYEMRPIQLGDGRVQHWVPISDEIKPEYIKDRGTMVVLLGSDGQDDTMQAAPGTPSPSRWIGRYLNTRYFKFPDGVTVRAREGWTFPRSDTNNNVLRRVAGQEEYLLAHAQASGIVDLNSKESGCEAQVRWYVLKQEPALDSNSGYIASSGHAAALFQNELYEMVSGRAGVARLQLFGVIFGYKRVVLYVEPQSGAGGSVAPDTTRQRLLYEDAPLPWEEWAAEFRSAHKFPAEMIALMDEVTGDPDEADDVRDVIKERLSRIKDLLHMSRYRRTAADSDLRASTETVGGAAKAGDTERSGTGKSGGKGGRDGDIYTLWVDPEGAQVERITIDNIPETVWVTIENGMRTPPALEDRAAKYLQEQNLIQANGNFRGYIDMVERWYKKYGSNPGTLPVIENVIREWSTLALTETVLGVQGLQGSPEWTPDDVSKALSEEALTSAVMQRYHVDNSVKRALGAKLGSLQETRAA